MRPSDYAPPTAPSSVSPQPPRAATPRGVTQGIAVQLVGVTIAVTGVAVGVEPYENGVGICVLGVAVAIIGLVMHAARV